jgi:pyruvate kinase
MQNKQTKIICTIADNRCEREFIQELYNRGMNVARLNTAHMSTEAATGMLEIIRSVSPTIGILIDTKGPEVRTCNIEEALEVKTGDRLDISGSCTPENGIRVNYDNFSHEVPVGNSIMIDDGVLELQVIARNGEVLECIARNDGMIKGRKSVNVPGVRIDMPSLSEKDADFIHWSTENDVDFIAHSFVRNRDDLIGIQSILDMRKSPIKIIAKIENREGVENIDSILDIAHSVMVARGDLGIEVPAEEVPILQKMMIQTCIKRMKPVITATQMLHSMIENPRATRAEVSDVANAIFDGTDAIMLSGETTYGQYAFEAVSTMRDIAYAVEAQMAKQPNRELQRVRDGLQKHVHLAKSAVVSADTLPVKAIITSTKSGDTALICSSFRGNTPIYAISQYASTVRQLSLCHGVYAKQMDIPTTADEMVATCIQNLIDSGDIGLDDLIVFIGGGHVYSAHTNLLIIDTPRTLLRLSDRLPIQ